MKNFLLVGASIALLMPPAGAGDWQVSPYETAFDPYVLSIGGSAHGALFKSFQAPAAGRDRGWTSGAASLHMQLTREYDTGMAVALKTDALLFHDRLTDDNYGGDFLQRLYGQVQTGLGTVEIGMNDGVGTRFALTGPVVDKAVSIDDARTRFFRDPDSMRAFIAPFALNTALEASRNFAKISYYTPRLFGIQIGASFTPSQAKDVLPFASSGDKIANRQESLWEVAASYRKPMGKFEIGFAGAAIFGHADKGMKTAGHQGLTEFSLGADLAYPCGEDLKLTLGGGYRHSNAYRFDLYDVREAGGTHSAHLGAKIENGPFAFGIEYGDGTADGGTGSAKIGVRGYGVAGSYALNRNLSISLGWQQLRYAGDNTLFYNNKSNIILDALFLHMTFKVESHGY